MILGFRASGFCPSSEGKPYVELSLEFVNDASLQIGRTALESSWHSAQMAPGAGMMHGSSVSSREGLRG